MSIEMSARIGAMIVHTASTRGVPAELLTAATGFDPASAATPDARMTLETETALWEEAARRSGDDHIGLHAAELLRPGVFDVLDYVLRSAPTVSHALERLARYNRLEHDAAVYTLLDETSPEHGALTRVEHAFLNGFGVQSRHSAEFTLASHVVIASQITGVRLPPLAVEFRHAEPSSLDEHVRVFGVRPRFAAPVNALLWRRADLERPSLQADAALSRIVERHAQALLDAMPEPGGSYAQRVRRQLTEQLGRDAVSLQLIARSLRVSERSLQRRLASEQTTFDALLDEVRRELGLRYIADPTLSISEVAYLLSYSEPSPFHRAFRRWTGKTAGAVRSELAAAALRRTAPRSVAAAPAVPAARAAR